MKKTMHTLFKGDKKKAPYTKPYKKYRSKTAFVALLLAAIFIAGCSYTTPSDTVGESSSPDVSADDYADKFAQVSAERVIEEPEGITAQRIFEAQDGVMIAVDYPLVEKSQPISDELSAYASAIVESFRQEADAAKKESKDDLICELTMPYRPYVVGENLLSVQFTKNEKAGKIDRQSYVESFVYDMEAGERLRIFDIFDEGTDYLSVLSERVRAVFATNDIMQAQENNTLLETGTAPEVQNFSNFVITPEGNIIFYYNKNTVAPAVADFFAASLPLGELTDYIRPDKQSLVLGAAAQPEESPEQTTPPEGQTATPTAVTVFPSGENDMAPGSIEGLDIYNDKFVALTFDDGPAPSTPAILDLLKDNDIKATFFVVGDRIADYTDIFTRTWQEGHEIATHSWDHSSNDLKWTLDEINAQTGQTNDAIQAITGQRAIIDRPTEGAINEEVAVAIGRPQILWNVDTLDWKSRDPQAILNETVNQVRDGSVILMHDLHETTIQGTALVIAELKNQGYKFVTVTQMMQIAAARGKDVGYIFNSAPTALDAVTVQDSPGEAPAGPEQSTEPEESAA